MRNIIILVLVTIALAILRMLVSDVTKAVSRSLGRGKKGGEKPAEAESARRGGRLVRDPETGAYVDEDSAVKATLGNATFFFESEQSRDAYLRKRRETKS